MKLARNEKLRDRQNKQGEERINRIKIKEKQKKITRVTNEMTWKSDVWLTVHRNSVWIRKTN